MCDGVDLQLNGAGFTEIYQLGRITEINDLDNFKNRLCAMVEQRDGRWERQCWSTGALDPKWPPVDESDANDAGVHHMMMMMMTCHRHQTTLSDDDAPL